LFEDTATQQNIVLLLYCSLTLNYILLVLKNCLTRSRCGAKIRSLWDYGNGTMVGVQQSLIIGSKEVVLQEPPRAGETYITWNLIFFLN